MATHHSTPTSSNGPAASSLVRAQFAGALAAAALTVVTVTAWSAVQFGQAVPWRDTVIAAAYWAAVCSYAAATQSRS